MPQVAPFSFNGRHLPSLRIPIVAVCPTATRDTYFDHLRSSVRCSPPPSVPLQPFGTTTVPKPMRAYSGCHPRLSPTCGVAFLSISKSHSPPPRREPETHRILYCVEISAFGCSQRWQELHNQRKAQQPRGRGHELAAGECLESPLSKAAARILLLCLAS